MEDRKLLILDANAIIHRAFHALPPLSTKNGEMVNAVYGFLLVFFRAVKEFNPYYIVAAFDYPAPSFRQKKYKLYKANRVKAPDELYSQMPKVKDILESLGIPVMEKQGFEADDLIGTISKTAPQKQIYPQIQSIIVSGDADVLQLVDKNTSVYLLRRGVKDIVLCKEEEVKEKYGGLLPSQLVDYKSLRGDPSDNIPGVFGVGEKTAIELIKKFGTVENLYETLEKNGEDIKDVKIALRQKLKDYKTQAEVSKMLAEIKKDVDIDIDLEKCKWGGYDRDKAVQIFEKYEFKNLLERLDNLNKPEKKQDKLF